MSKVALITGANKGIGFELARQLGKRGVRVILTSRDGDKGMAAREQLVQEGLQVDFVPMDVSSWQSVCTGAQLISSQCDHLDILVNNAGVFSEPGEDGLSASVEEIQRVMDTNTFGPLRVTQALAPLLKASPQARVINVSSGLGQLHDMDNQYPAYSISKAALNAVTRILAAELAPFNVTVNSICPGWVRTDMGGPSAERSAEESVAGVLPLLLDENERRTGQFLRDGQPIPW